VTNHSSSTRQEGAGRHTVWLAFDLLKPPFRRSTFGKKWRSVRALVGRPESFRFYDLRHTGHTLSTRSGVKLKDTMARVGQSSEKAALIYQRSETMDSRKLLPGSTRPSAGHVGKCR
jgi:Phage integrase family.